jgi:hypothetical protein
VTIDAWLIVARWLHVLAVSLLFGAALFPFYGVEARAAELDPALRRLPRLLMWSAALALSADSLVHSGVTAIVRSVRVAAAENRWCGCGSCASRWPR